MTLERQRPGWGFWLWWVLATAVGVVVGSAAVVAFDLGVGTVIGTYDVPSLRVFSVAFGAVIGALIGAPVGLTQAFVLRQQFSGSGWWVLVSILGCSVGAGVGWVGLFFALFSGYDFYDWTGATMAGAALGAPMGAVLGATQWLVLRRRVSLGIGSSVLLGLSVLSAWTLGGISGTTGGLAVLFGTGNTTVNMPGFGGTLLVIMVGTIGGTVIGAVTGAALVWLLRQNVPEK